MIRSPNGRPWVSALALLLVSAFLLVSVHPYTGVRHDGVLYAVQALYRLYPEIFAEDIFFKFGSQDAFSFFSTIYAAAIRVAGFETAVISLLVLAHALFVLASWLWVRHVIEPDRRWAAMVCICLSAGGYGGYLVFHYAEAFLTARPFAEALVISSLPFMHSRRYWIALALIAGAAMLHPLVALSALACWWVLRMGDDRRWAWLALAALPAIYLGNQGVEPFAKLFLTYDFDWRSSILISNAFVFISVWPTRDYMMLATDFAFLVVAMPYVPERLRTMLKAVVIVGVGAFCVALIGADWLSNALISALQLWRAQWLMHFFAMSVLVFIAIPVWKWSNAGKVCAMLLVYAAVNRGTVSGFGALLLGLALVYGIPLKGWAVERNVVRLVGAVLVVGLLAAWQNNVYWNLSDVKQLNGSVSWEAAFLTYLRKPPVGPALLAGPLLWLLWRYGRSLAVTAGVAAVSIWLIAASWDQRSEWARIVEGMPIGTHPFAAYVAPSEEVYWLNDAFAPWLMMKRRSYVSAMQSAGQPFNRGTAYEVSRRSKVVASFDFQAEICRLMNALNKTESSCDPDIQTIRFACESDSALSHVVTRFKLERGTSQAQWQPEQRGAEKLPMYYLYSCRSLLASAAGKAP